MFVVCIAIEFDAFIDDEVVIVVAAPKWFGIW